MWTSRGELLGRKMCKQTTKLEYTEDKKDFPFPSSCAAEWQVMCVFKALHTNREEEHTDLCLEEFYTFYEVQNLKWTQVRREERE